ncbi:MAG TPA: efflux transporter outer membrane subunit [Acetobacteraceae bacterium]|nr:efflux transporter outer membrane subunit [Acetobacteraceae bacterium]
MRVRRLSLVSLATLLLLGGCMVGPNYHRPAAIVPTHYKELSGWVVAQPQESINRGAWWSVFNDPVLDSLERQVNVSNQTVRADVAAYFQARALVDEARAGLYPTLSANAGVTRQSSSRGSLSGGGTTAAFSAEPVTATNYTLEGTGAWDLDLWGAIRRQVQANVAAAQVSAADLAEAELSEQAALASDYFQLRAADADEKLLQDTVAAFRRTLVITQNQYAAGVAARSDVLAALVQVQNAQVSAIAAGVARAEFEHAIAVLIGKPPADLTIPPGTLASNVPVVPAGIPSTLLERRPDIAAAERTMDEENALIGVQVAAYYPVVDLSAVFGYVGNPVGSLIQLSNRIWSLGANATESLFQGGERSAAVAAAAAAYDESVANYRNTVLTAFQGVEDQLSSLRILAEEYQAQQAAVASATEEVTITLNEYEAGTQAYTAVVVAQTTQLADQESLLTVQQNRLLASVSLIEDLGGGWSANELPTANALQQSNPLIPNLPN